MNELKIFHLHELIFHMRRAHKTIVVYVCNLFRVLHSYICKSTMFLRELHTIDLFFFIN